MHQHRNRRRTPPPSPGRAVLIQPLEGRQLMSTVVSPSVTLLAAGSTVTGYTPSQITTAYDLAGLKFGSTAANGAGQTIAIVDAYNAPNIAADLATFDAEFGLSTASLTVVSQTGSTTDLPATDDDWAEEISLDVEWAHAVAPGAKILLVETDSDSTGDLMAGVDYARSVAGVSVVSMSWGTTEFADETSYDSYFTTPSDHTGITFVAAAGDDGSSGGAEWPAAAAGVVSVGGTTLTLSGSGAYESETGWSDGGGGASLYEGEAAFQYAVQRTGYRTTPDVSWDADTSTGLAVYDSLDDDGDVGWLEFGGTSAGTPEWGALIAIADQGRSIDGADTLDGATTTLPTLYGLYAHQSTDAADFNDITSGSTSRSISATTGYDEVSGIGTPKGAALVADLVSTTVSIALKQTTVTYTPPANPGPRGPIGWRYRLALQEVDAGPATPATPADGTDGGPPDSAGRPVAAEVDVGRVEIAGGEPGPATTTAVAWTNASGISVTEGDGSRVVPPVTATPANEVGVLAVSGGTSGAAASGTPMTTASVASTATVSDVSVLVAGGMPPPRATPDISAGAASAWHPAGWGVAGAAVALWLATDPIRARRREMAEQGGDAGSLMYHHLIAPGLLRG